MREHDWVVVECWLARWGAWEGRWWVYWEVAIGNGSVWQLVAAIDIRWNGTEHLQMTRSCGIVRG